MNKKISKSLFAKALATIIAVLSMISCNESLERLTNDSYPESETSANNGHVLFIIIDGASGKAVNEAYTTRKAPYIRSMTESASFTFNGIADSKHNSISKERGWANLLTGVTDHGVGLEKEDGSVKTIEEMDTPTFMRRLKQDNENIKISLYASDPDFYQVFNSDANDSQSASTDQGVNDALIDEVGSSSPSDIIVAQFSGVQVAGDANGFYDSSDNPTTEVLDAIQTVDGYIGEVKTALETRKNYKSENWLIIITSTYGGEYTGTIDAKTRFDSPSLNTFSMVYNNRLVEKILLKPAEGEGLAYSYVTPVYTPSASGTPVAAVVNDATLFNLPAGKPFTLQLMLIDRHPNPSGVQAIVSKASNASQTRQNGEWLFKFDGSNTRYWHTSNNDTQVTSNTSETGPAKDNPYKYDRKSKNFTVLTFVHDFDCAGKTMPGPLAGGTYTARANGEVRTYRNGILARHNLQMRTGETNLTMANNTKPFTIGQIYTSAAISTATEFSVVNLQIYDTVLPPDYLGKNYNKAQIDLDSLSCPYWKNLIGYWPCDREEDRELGILRDYSRYGSVYNGINAGRSDMKLTGNIQWYENATIEPYVRPLPNESFYKTVFNTVDLSLQTFMWMSVIPQPSWKLEGMARALEYTSMNE
ncbi:DUF4983 domain-containing protein [Dysgonomonas sp. GY75]|uniref:DUF4983 domain-containing protein n=1 Tax=Dysgonomonas sp. GY75 TaxID=2780419 RepID=UPI001883BF21|nr:DUF4983 domain-containing protein [Dysgonomonas sp. GY75]MBF0648220.1 DUF4983 domain-containing protein [Dysgonomonas sp. GY75]